MSYFTKNERKIEIRQEKQTLHYVSVDSSVFSVISPTKIDEDRS